VTLLNTGHVTTNLQDFHVSGESVRELDRKRYDAESFDVSICVASGDNDKTLPLSCTVLDTSAIFTSVTLTVITDLKI
jgi:hypothetical protein